MNKLNEYQMNVPNQNKSYLWTDWLIVMVGVWMLASPLTFEYGKDAVMPSGGREVWLSLENRVLVSRINDFMCGFLLVLLGLYSIQFQRSNKLWLPCFVGIWLSAAPLVFWAPHAFIYLNDTLMGAAIIALAVLIPRMSNGSRYTKSQIEIPQGWSFNPSDWSKRSLLIALSFLAWLTSRYLAVYQLGYRSVIEDPFFGLGSVKVLDSALSKSLPISDAGLGSLAYTFECLMAFMGGTTRWRTMPWLVALFGLMVIPVGLVSIILVTLQPLVVGAWCTLCLLTALIMLPMIPLEIDEFAAMIQHLTEKKNKGESVWQVFWNGGNEEENQENRNYRDSDSDNFSKPHRMLFSGSTRGMSFPMTLILSAFIGGWLMTAPYFLDIENHRIVANCNHIIGALIFVCSIIAMSEILRVGRYANIFLGLLLAIISLFIEDGNLLLTLNNIFFGLAVGCLAFPRGTKKESYGCFEKYIQ